MLTTSSTQVAVALLLWPKNTSCCMSQHMYVLLHALVHSIDFDF
jgi:hypothetical protein